MRFPNVGYRIVLAVIPPLFSAALRIFGWTWRVRPVDAGRHAAAEAAAKAGHAVFACWHQRILYFTRFMRRKPSTVLVSLSREGELIDRILRRLGFQTVRGSSSRGAEAGLLGMIDAVKAGRTASYMADGPKGPPRIAKIGPVATARGAGTGGVWIGTTAAWPVVTLGSWDRTQIPLPFARVVVDWAGPIPVPPDADREGLEAARLAVEQALNDATDRCDRAVGREPKPTPTPTAARESL